MGGMGGGLGDNNPTIVTAFHQALLHGGMVVLVLAAVVAVVWTTSRAAILRQRFAAANGEGTATAGDTVPAAGSDPSASEAPARRLLRIGFGLLWVFDGILQGQASMPLGMIDGVVKPAAASSPIWVRHLVDSAASAWTNHPATAAAAVVWIQVGVGLFVLVGGRGEWGRLAGVFSAAWGVVVWVFGEAFGSIFAPGLTVLFGAPGAAVFYIVAGLLVALPPGAWSTPRLGRWLLRGVGVFLLGMGVLQAWPGRGFWQGQIPGSRSTGSLTSMVQQMAQTPQPRVLADMVNAFAGFDSAHGWAVNLFAVVILLGVGGTLVSARPRAVRPALLVAAVVFLADWVLIEDLGFMGGTGTDPNSMIPLLLVMGAGYLALDPATAPASAGVGWRTRLATEPTYRLRAAAALAAVGVTVVGAAPLAVAATNSAADPILAQAIAGPINATDFPAAPFQLTDQAGRPVSLADLRGQAAIVTFLDPVCTTDCPVIASEMRQADSHLGGDASRVELVAIDANPRYRAVQYTDAFDQQEGLQTVPNWEYLTGSLPQLQQVWRAWGIDVEYGTGGAMIIHSDVAYIVDPSGRVRSVIQTDPGRANPSTTSSFGQLFARSVEQALHP